MRVEDPIYGKPVTIYYECSVDECTRITQKMGLDKFEHDACAAYWEWDAKRDAVIVIGKGCKTHHFVHELIHHAIKVFGSAGIPIEPKHDEPFAYYLQLLVSQCNRR